MKFDTEFFFVVFLIFIYISCKTHDRTETNTQKLRSFFPPYLNCRKVPFPDFSVHEVPDLLSDRGHQDHHFLEARGVRVLSDLRPTLPSTHHVPEVSRLVLLIDPDLRSSTPCRSRRQPQPPRRSIIPRRISGDHLRARISVGRFRFRGFVGSRVLMGRRRTTEPRTNFESFPHLLRQPRPRPTSSPGSRFLHTLIISHNSNSSHNSNNNNKHHSSNEKRHLIRSCHNTKQIATSV